MDEKLHSYEEALEALKRTDLKLDDLPKHSDPNGLWVYNLVDDSYGFPKWY